MAALNILDSKTIQAATKAAIEGGKVRKLSVSVQPFHLESALSA